MIVCAFCHQEARHAYKQLGLCNWHQLLLYLGVVYVAEKKT